MSHIAQETGDAHQVPDLKGSQSDGRGIHKQPCVTLQSVGTAMTEVFTRVCELRRGTVRLKSIKEWVAVTLSLGGHGQISLQELREGHSRKRKQYRQKKKKGQPEGVGEG